MCTPSIPPSPASTCPCPGTAWERGSGPGLARRATASQANGEPARRTSACSLVAPFGGLRGLDAGAWGRGRPRITQPRPPAGLLGSLPIPHTPLSRVPPPYPHIPPPLHGLGGEDVSLLGSLTPPALSPVGHPPHSRFPWPPPAAPQAGRQGCCCTGPPGPGQTLVLSAVGQDSKCPWSWSLGGSWQSPAPCSVQHVPARPSQSSVCCSCSWTLPGTETWEALGSLHVPSRCQP